MTTLITFFVKYLLAPIIVLVLILVMGSVAKGKGVLKMKKLIIFVLLLSLILGLPSFLGLLKYEFIWGGLLLSILSYLIFGALFNWFSTTDLFKTIGISENKWHTVLALTIAMVLGGWIYYLIFDWLNNLGYSHWAMTNVLWFIIPVLFKYSRESFVSVQNPFYLLWFFGKGNVTEEYWNMVDTFRLMQVTVKIKRKVGAETDASFSVKMPEDVSLGDWFDRFVTDQNIRFPSNTIEVVEEGGAYGWIFYTSKWFKFPLFTRMLDFEGDVKSNALKNKKTIYIRRVSVKEHKVEL